MTSKLKSYLTHARVVLTDEIIEDGSLLIEDGNISAINPESVKDANTINQEY